MFRKKVPNIPTAPGIPEVPEGLHRLIQAIKDLNPGQDGIADLIVASLFAGGHALLVGEPGLGKSSVVSSLARLAGLSFNRIHMASDLLPSDVAGSYTHYTDSITRELRLNVVKGPLFANVVLIEELERAAPLVQDTILGAARSGKVAIAAREMTLPAPFHVFATEDPLEQTQKISLTFSQLDYFMMTIRFHYPSAEEELASVGGTGAGSLRKDTGRVLSMQDVVDIRRIVSAVYLDSKLARYCISLVQASRPLSSIHRSGTEHLNRGAGPRATQDLMRLARALALVHGRGYVVPEDIREAFSPVMTHRVELSYEAESEDMQKDDIFRRIVDSIRIP